MFVWAAETAGNSTDELTRVLAVIGAVTGVLALVLNFVQLRRGRYELRVVATHRSAIGDFDTDSVFVIVENVGGTATQISGVALRRYPLFGLVAVDVPAYIEFEGDSVDDVRSLEAKHSTNFSVVSISRDIPENVRLRVVVRVPGKKFKSNTFKKRLPEIGDQPVLKS